MSMTNGSWRAPQSFAHEMGSTVDLNDACMECGYQFAYELEGCDSCRPITELLKLAKLTRMEET